jgi:tudor domain-containing protein 1/4/6/7
MPDDLSIGRPVLAQFTDDQGWYRAVITKRNQGVSVVTFVDYGNQDTLQNSSLIEIPPRFLSLPAQAIHCSLDGVGVQVSPETAKTAFNDLTLEQEARGDVRSVLQGSSGPIYTLDLFLADGSKPVTALVEGGHISIPKSTLSHLSPSSSPTLTEVKVPSFPTNAHIDVCVSYVESPANFFIHLLENFDRVEELTQGLDEVYSKMSQREAILFDCSNGRYRSLLQLG